MLPASRAFWSAWASFCLSARWHLPLLPRLSPHPFLTHPGAARPQKSSSQPAGGQGGPLSCLRRGPPGPTRVSSEAGGEGHKAQPQSSLLRQALSLQPSALIECPLLSNDLSSGRASKPLLRAEDGVAPTLTDRRPAVHPGARAPLRSARRMGHFHINVQSAHVPAFPRGLGEGSPLSGGLVPPDPSLPHIQALSSAAWPLGDPNSHRKTGVEQGHVRHPLLSCPWLNVPLSPAGSRPGTQQTARESLM